MSGDFSPEGHTRVSEQQSVEEGLPEPPIAIPKPPLPPAEVVAAVPLPPTPRSSSLSETSSVDTDLTSPEPSAQLGQTAKLLVPSVADSDTSAQAHSSANSSETGPDATGAASSRRSVAPPCLIEPGNVARAAPPKARAYATDRHPDLAMRSAARCKHTWTPCPGAAFHVRHGPDYRRTGHKAPSAGTIYEVRHVT